MQTEYTLQLSSLTIETIQNVTMRNARHPFMRNQLRHQDRGFNLQLMVYLLWGQFVCFFS